MPQRPDSRASVLPSVVALLVTGIATSSAVSPLEPDVSFAEAGKLLASQGEARDEFGWSADLDGDTLIVGAWLDDDLGPSSGGANVFQRDGSGIWREVALLTAPDGLGHDRFGTSVAVSGDWGLVGAPGDDNLGSSPGAAYLFERNSGGPDNWGFVRKLVAGDGDVNDLFGESTALFGETAIVGAPGDEVLGDDSGSAYIFERDAGGPSNWGEVAKLTAFDGEASDDFAIALDLHADRAIVGASGGNQGTGAAYVFERDVGGPDNWGLVTKIVVADGFDNDRLGGAVAVAGETAIVGADGDDGPGPVFEQGSAYIFERNAGGPDNWGQVAKLIPIDGSTSDHFGEDVAIDGDTVVVGSYLDDEQGTNSGSAYLFRRNEGGPEAWGKIAKVIASDGTISDYFGSEVALDGDTLVVAAPENDDLGEASGAVYVFEEIAVDPTLALTGVCPGEVTFAFAGGTPLGRAGLAFSQKAGEAPIARGPCAGIESGLAEIHGVGVLALDSDGELALDADLPAAACGQLFQAIDLVSCATSETTTTP